MKATFLLGRLVFGGFFIYNGIHHLQERKSMGQYAKSKNVPLAEAAVAATGVALIAGGTGDATLLGSEHSAGTLRIVPFTLRLTAMKVSLSPGITPRFAYSI